MESRIHREVYVRFGGERLETYHSNMTRRWALILLVVDIKSDALLNLDGCLRQPDNKLVLI
ncbi:hypothetical protein FSZ17_13495 [Cytobacillus dafuensis]|uniref:Uncharacterized protein n=1 Tax=Cytobacillus dafuensis TaxID=1742359 RepID=A0A5B8Z5J5_CYTDA|nr:hypothetical protein FSZ17_13495 [Cytobacillus dafuensis]